MTIKFIYAISKVKLSKSSRLQENFECQMLYILNVVFTVYSSKLYSLLCLECIFHSSVIYIVDKLPGCGIIENSWNNKWYLFKYLIKSLISKTANEFLKYS